MRDLDDDFRRDPNALTYLEEQAVIKVLHRISWGSCHYVAKFLGVPQIAVFTAAIELEWKHPEDTGYVSRAKVGIERDLWKIESLLGRGGDKRIQNFVINNSIAFREATRQQLHKFIEEHQEIWDRMTTEINHPVEDWSKPDADLFAEGKKIRTYRKENDITQTAAMALFGCTLVELGRMERGFHVRDGLLAHARQIVQFGVVVPAPTAPVAGDVQTIPYNHRQ